MTSQVRSDGAMQLPPGVQDVCSEGSQLLLEKPVYPEIIMLDRPHTVTRSRAPAAISADGHSQPPAMAVTRLAHSTQLS